MSYKNNNTASNSRSFLGRHARPGSGKTKNGLVLNALPLAFALAAQYRGRGVDYDDLISEAIFGLRTAADRFDPKRGAFASVATYYVRNQINESLADNGYGIRRPRHYWECRKAITSTEITLTHKLEREPTSDEIADHAGLRRSTVRAARDRHVTVVALEDPLDADRNVAANVADEQADIPDVKLETKDSIAAVRESLAKLTDRERDLIERRFGIGREPETLAEIGRRHGVTRESVRQVQNRVLGKLKDMLVQTDPVGAPDFDGTVPAPKVSPHWRNCQKCFRVIVNGDPHECPPGSLPFLASKHIKIKHEV